MTQTDLLYASALALFAAALPSAATTTANAGKAEQPPEIIAAHIRDQGFECQKPRRAVREHAESTPDEAVWLLECEGAKYRVRLVPDLAAKVERLD